MGKQRKKNGRWEEAPSTLKAESESESEDNLQENSSGNASSRSTSGHGHEVSDNSEQHCLETEKEHHNEVSNISPARKEQHKQVNSGSPVREEQHTQVNSGSPVREEQHNEVSNGSPLREEQHDVRRITSAVAVAHENENTVIHNSHGDPPCQNTETSSQHLNSQHEDEQEGIQDDMAADSSPPPNLANGSTCQVSVQNNNCLDDDSVQIASVGANKLSQHAPSKRIFKRKQGDSKMKAGTSGKKGPSLHKLLSSAIAKHGRSKHLGASSKMHAGQRMSRHGKRKHRIRSSKLDPLQDLKEYIERLGGSLEEGWTVTTNKKYKFYISPKYKRFTARTQVARFLGLSPRKKGSTENKQINAEQSMISPNHVQNPEEDPLKSLQEYIENLGGYLPKGWRFEQHKTYVAYFSPSNRKFTAKHQVAEYLGLHFHGIAGIPFEDLQIAAVTTEKPKANGKSENTSANNSNKKNSGLIQDSGKYKKNQELGSGANTTNSLVLKETKSSQLGNESPISNLVTKRCEEVFRSIISAETFASLSKILSGGLQPICLGDASKSKTSAPFSGTLDLQLISLRLSSGAYGQKPEMFSADVQQVWNDISMVGQELVNLSASLSKLSDNLFKDQVLSLLQVGNREKSPTKISRSNGMLRKDSNIGAVDVKNKRKKKLKTVCKKCGSKGDKDCLVCSVCNATYHSSCVRGTFSSRVHWCCPSCTAEQGTADVTKDSINNIEKVQVSMSLQSSDELSETNSGPCKITANGSICKKCGKMDKHVLMCDSCDAAYHMNCVTPPIDHVPKEYWYCPDCDEAQKKKVHVPKVVNQEEHHCAVCDRIRSDSSLFLEETLENGSPNVKEKTIWNPEANTVGTGSSEEQHLDSENEAPCKLCGARSQMQQIQCNNCTNYYHLSCLKAPIKKLQGGIWYCPSCLCRICEVDVDDDQILLCDSCDEGFHTYCLSPPLKSIPKGAWFCTTCTALKNPDPKSMSTTAHAKSNNEGIAKKKRKQPG